MRLTPRERWIGFAVTAMTALYVWFTLQPDLVLSNTTANGGDTGAHVWWPAYLRDHILPKWRLTGWAPDWYAGFPAGHFYFPLPSLLVVALDVFLPYNVAFKLVTALGPVTLPLAAYYFAKGIGARWPAPPLFAVATLPYLFYTGYSIWGGNLASTLAGEFSFTIALSLCLVFLGALASAFDRRGGFALPAAVLAATAMSHIIVAIFAGLAAVVMWLTRRPRHNLPVAAGIGIVGILLTAVWSLPLVARLGYATDMGWTKMVEYRKHLFPSDLRWALVLAVVGVVAGIVFARRATILLFLLAVILGFGFVFLPEARLWNARIMPFYYLMVMFLAACGLAELAGALGRVASAARSGAARLAPARRARAGAGGDLAPVDPIAFVLADESFFPGGTPEPPGYPAGTPEPPGYPAGTPESPGAPPAAPPPSPEVPPPPARRVGFGWVVNAVVVVVALGAAMQYTYQTRRFLPLWIRWNYSGYEAKPAYPEFRELIQTMEKLPAGRAVWEPSQTLDKYGTTLALELLPHFTNGRIGSVEGLYFESSATVPYHFMMVAELAKQPSNPVRDLRYRTLADFDLGVRHMRLMGVRYFMAQSAEAKAVADVNQGLRLVAETGRPDVEPVVARWKIYEVLDSPLVSPLVNEPVVLEGVSAHGWLRPAADWFDDPAALDRPLVADGPEGWVRATPSEARSVTRRPLPDVKVSGIESGDDWIRFKVSRPGVPIVVKTSFFPNWQADGARGPYRASPNLMVVVPTGTDVTLHYGRTGVDWAGLLLSGLGLAGLVLLSCWRAAPLPPARRRRARDGDGTGESAGDGAAAAEDGGSSEKVRAPALT